jgi:1-acyl-sn-glycerol-3-phosphate acyltransferase
MDVEKRSLSAILKNVFVILWLVLSTIVYASLCIILAPVNKRSSRFFCVLWSRHLLMVAGVKVMVQGAEKLDPCKRYVFIANHQSHIDIPVLYKALRPHFLSFIAKKELFRIPLFGWAMYAIGHIWIDRENARKAHASIKQAIDRLQKENISLVLFPEGTRSSDGAIGRLKQGSFALVLQAGVEIVPVALHDTHRILAKHSKNLYKGTAHVTVGAPLSIDPVMTKAEIGEMVREVLVAALEEGKMAGTRGDRRIEVQTDG